MSTPTKYHPAFDFSDAAPGPDVGVALDAELVAVAQSVAETVRALGDIRRSDGALRNGLVGDEQIASGVVDEFLAPMAELVAHAEDAEAIATDASQETAAARDAAQATSHLLAAKAASIALYGWPDYGSISDPPGPPGNETDYGSIG